MYSNGKCAHKGKILRQLNFGTLMIGSFHFPDVVYIAQWEHFMQKNLASVKCSLCVYVQLQGQAIKPLKKSWTGSYNSCS